MRSKTRRFANARCGGGKTRVGKGEKCRRLRRAARDSQHGAEEIMQVAESIGLGCLLRVRAKSGIGGMPILVRNRGLLREQHGEYEEDAPRRAMRGILATSPGTPPARRGRCPSAASSR